MKIHPTAIVSPQAKLAEGVEIGPYAVISDDVSIGQNTIIGSHTVIDEHTDIGENCHIFQFCSIGAPPQDLKYKGEPTRVVIGHHNVIREFVTIHRSTPAADENITRLGDHNLIMAYCHIAHNCVVGNHVIMSNAATLAGHIMVEDYAIISGLTGLHQFTVVGAHAFVGGASAVVKDVPPYTIAQGNHAKLFGLNLIGLQRRGFSEKTIKAIKDAYRIIFRSNMLLEEALETADKELGDIPEVRYFINFIRNSKRGVCR